MDNFKDNLIEELTNNPLVGDFLVENDIKSYVFEKYLSDLLTFKTEIAKCDSCKSLLTCTQDIKGIQPVLRYENEQIKIIYKECLLKHRYNIKRKQNKLLNALYMPKMIDKADLEDYRNDTPERIEIYQYMMRFLKLYPMGEKMLGMYLQGQYQRGKTYTLAALSNSLSKLGYKVIIAYYPDLVREFKASISKGNLDVIIKELKEVDILMLDDIGGEAQSAWVRDEILGPILQHRLLDELPTFFSSNVGRKELGKYLAINEQKAEKMKAYRIVTRIISLTKEFNM
ncbi:MAG: primosomal protein DnaI [Candidatus Izemoplasma sp.]